MLHNTSRRAEAIGLACAPFTLERLRELDSERLLYEGTKPGPGGSGPLRSSLLPPKLDA